MKNDYGKLNTATILPSQGKHNKIDIIFINPSSQKIPHLVDLHFTNFI